MFVYTVSTTFEGSPEQVTARAKEYEAWLVNGHLRDVVKAGALEATLHRFDGPAYDAQYVFADREAFTRYEQGPAVALRAEGAAKFPPSSGVRFSRRTSERLAHVSGARP